MRVQTCFCSGGHGLPSLFVLVDMACRNPRAFHGTQARGKTLTHLYTSVIRLWGEKSLKSLFSAHTSALPSYLDMSSCSFSTGVSLVSEQPVSQPSNARSILRCSEFQQSNEQVVIRLLVQGTEHDRGTCPVELKERYPCVE